MMMRNNGTCRYQHVSRRTQTRCGCSSAGPSWNIALSRALGKTNRLKVAAQDWLYSTSKLTSLPSRIWRLCRPQAVRGTFVVAASIQREDASLRCRCKAPLTSWTRFGIRFAPCVLLACASCRFWVCHVIWDQGICAGTELEKGRPLVFKQPSHDMVACKRPKWFSPCGPNEQPCTPGHLPRAVGIDICLHVGGHYPNLVFLLGVGPTPRWHQFVLSPMIQIPGSPAGADRVLLQGGWPWRSAGQDPATSSL